MKRFFMTLAVMAGIACVTMNAQETKSLSDYDAVRFYGIDFAPVKVVAAEETAGEFIAAFSEINRLLITRRISMSRLLPPESARRLTM